MKLNKEQIAFGVIVLLVAWLAYSELASKKSGPPRGKKKKWKARGQLVDMADLKTMKASLVSDNESTWTLSGRNIYRAPKEYVPMPPLNLSAPPRATMVTSTPQPIPGPDPFSRMATVAAVIPVDGVELAPRQEEPNATDELQDSPEDIVEDSEESSSIGTVVNGNGEVENQVQIEIEELEKKLGEVRKTLDGKKQDETANAKKKKKRRMKKILGLRELLQKDAEAKIEAERADRQKLRDIAERQRTLDKIFWVSGEVWYGSIENDEVAPEGSEGLDKYEIKLAIDAIRRDTRLSGAALAEKLGNRKLEVEFARWNKRKWSSKSKLSPLNVARVEFAEAKVAGSYTVDQFELDRRTTPKSELTEHIALANKLQGIQEFGRAKEHLKGLVDHGHEDLALYQALALAANRDFDYDVEAMAVNEGLKKHPKDAVLLSSSAELFSRLGLEELATDMFSQAATLAPRDAQVNARHGRHLVGAKIGGRAKSVEAKQLLEKAASGRFELPSEKRSVLLDLGDAQLASGNLKAAERAYEQVNSSEPDNIRALVGLANVDYAGGRVEAAKEKLTDALARAPENGLIYYNLALCAMDQEEWEVARDRFYDAMNADPFLTARAHCGLGFLFERIGKSAEAQAAYAQALEAEPDNGEVLYWNGRGYMLIGDYQQAFNFLRRALGQLPNQFDILAALSDSAFHLQKFEDSLRYVDAAMALRPQSPGLLVRKAQTLVRLRRFADAKKCLDQSKTQKDSDEVELSLAYFYYLEGNHSEALKRFRTVERSLDRRDESPLANYTRRYSSEIADNLSKKVWTDHFNRVATGSDLLRGWRTFAPGSGITMSLVNNQVSFGGTQKASDVPSCIFQRRSGREFVSFEAGLSAKPKGESVCGIGLFTFRKNTGDQNPFVDPDSGGIAYDGMVVGKNREGRLAYRVISRYQMGRWQVLPVAWPALVDGAAQQIVLGIASESGKKGTFSVLVNGSPVLTGIEIKGLRRTTKDLQLWAFSQAEIDRRVDVKVDDVRIVTRETKRK